ncbi:oxygen-independent coproporphyrinogen III oxidase [Pleionea litopenaei]|uniref:Coproporphyrinogen-III oxidase n=1 Tax=Pleionea litopenaei TaxID=3070815 RepID=A0AA51RWA4_9GAMM|nr:oxygen-independent coproporphyrinogen III oxidase [Pleionea sp. HL-JVS1]WMS88634.1 oxygen-independent coproporphyrinogen III oxidase [Pleionea sp. HL-JVS1]
MADGLLYPGPTVQWNDQLIERYSVSGPRYTSYPTALEFNESVGTHEYRLALAAIPASRNLSLYLHIPFCWHVCYYCACNKVVTRDYTRVAAYLDALEREIIAISKQLNGQTVTQLHWGGGTPTYLTADDRARLMNTLKKHFTFADDSEIESSIEVDPRTLKVDELYELREIGFNRLSLGVQDFNPGVQAAVNREQSFEQVSELMNKAREIGFSSISFDLIYGLPLQTVATFEKTLQQVIQLRPDRLSVFNYAHLPHRFAPQRRIDHQQIPSAKEKLNILHLTIDRMQQAGYQYIGMDHFALPSDELAKAQQQGVLHRNFQGYTTQENCDLIGLGVSSISALHSNSGSPGLYAQNHREIASYQAALEHSELATWRGAGLSKDDEVRRSVIFALICNFQLATEEFSQRTGIDFWQYFEDSKLTLQQYAADGLLELSDSHIIVTPVGRLLIRNICMAFDRYFFGDSVLASASGGTTAIPVRQLDTSDSEAENTPRRYSSAI